MRIQASTGKRGKGDIRDERGIGQMILTADSDHDREFITSIYRIRIQRRGKGKWKLTLKD